ncbi:extracellular matrix/biofilm biosynthesis regulator RemA family protein [Alkalihalobacillus sp. FSL R5-0424]
MFIHLGGDVMIRATEIIAILQYENSEAPEQKNPFITLAGAKESVTITPDLVKSVVITDHVIYYSPVSSITLNRRAQTDQGFKEELV